MLIGVTGLAQHGKDTIGNRLVKAHGFRRLGFANVLKELALRVNPIIPRHTTGTLVRLDQFVGEVGWEEAKKHGEVRRFLQELGTGVRDYVGDDVWIDALERRWLDGGDVDVVITDVRFQNEANWIRRNNGYLIRVVRRENGKAFDNGVDADHPSEKQVPFLPADLIVTNDADIIDLNLKVDKVIAALRGTVPRLGDSAD